MGTTTRAISARRALCSFLTAAALLGCGVEFDSVGQIDGLRVLGVQKDRPIARPGDTVTFRMVVHDTGTPQGGERQRSYFWLAGCDNPPGDTYQGCLAVFADVASNLGAILENPTSPEELDELAEQLQRAGITFGFSDTFQTKIDPDIIDDRPPSAVSDAAPYAVSFVFFAVCAGELRPDSSGGAFPVSCHDEDGTRLGPRDFVAGFSPVYTYEDQQNRIPEITGLRLSGRQLPRSAVCINEECEPVEANPERACPKGAPRIPRCRSGDLRQSCPAVDVAVVVDPQSVDQDAPLALGGEGAPEPMWVNYHTDRGSFTSDVVLVNDIEAGFRPNPETSYLSAEQAGPALIWAAVRDNRGGFAWARTSLCVE